MDFLCGLCALCGKRTPKVAEIERRLTAEDAECAEEKPSLGERMNGELDRLTNAIIGAAITVHRELGPGLLESAYEACLAFELTEKGFRVERQKQLPVTYRGLQQECGCRLDLLIENQVILELKATDSLRPIHDAQLLSYLKLAHKKVGLLINFNSLRVKDGIKRLVNNY